MPTFVVFARRESGALARVVMMLHRRAIGIRSLFAERMENRAVLGIEISIDADEDLTRQIEANLYKLVDVLLVKRVERVGRHELRKKERIGLLPMKVLYVITTGGTIEKEYSEPTGSVANLGGKIDRYLQLLRLPGAEIRVIPLLNKDSLDMTDSDRRLILGAVSGLLEERAPIVITHGTDTIVETGQFLDHAIGELDIPIVLTGAMVPLGFDGSDALQNLTESLFAARALGPGVYVVIHGEAFPIYRVRKDRARGRFVWTDEKLM